jgi:transcriptional regulator with XRE-family HTH domain
MKNKVQLQQAIGKRIKKLREDKHITQQDLATKYNIEKPNLSRLEPGRTNPTIYTFYKIAENLDVSLSELTKIVYLCCQQFESPSLETQCLHCFPVLFAVALH